MAFPYSANLYTVWLISLFFQCVFLTFASFICGLPSSLVKDLYTVFIRINAPGAMHFSKGGATITDTKTQLSSPVAMGDNGHLQP